MFNFILAMRTDVSHLERVILVIPLHFFDEGLVLLGTLLGGELKVTLLGGLENLNHSFTTLLLHTLLSGCDGSLALDATIFVLNEITLGETSSGVFGGTVKYLRARTFCYRIDLY